VVADQPSDEPSDEPSDGCREYRVKGGEAGEWESSTTTTRDAAPRIGKSTTTGKYERDEEGSERRRTEDKYVKQLVVMGISS
jgi:hypothetical protein